MINILGYAHSLDEFTLLEVAILGIPSALLQYILCSSAKSGFLLK